MRTTRVDRGTLRAPRRKANGTLIADGVFSRAGVFTYMNADGSARRELRLPEEVFRPDALESLEGLPVVNDHPAPGVTVPRGSGQGITQEGVKQEGDLVVGSVVVYDSHLIDIINSGKTALSIGYSVDYDPTPGVHPAYGKYDGVQRNIRGDHLAVVDIPRAPGARLRMDGVQSDDLASPLLPDLSSVNLSSSASPARNAPMDELKKQLAAAAEQIASLTVRVDSADKALADANARADKAEGALAAAQPELDALRAARKDEEDPAKLQSQITTLQSKLASEKERADKANDPDKFVKAVRARTRLERRAQMVLGPSVRLDVLSDKELHVASLEKLGKLVEKDRTDAYVEAMFETAVDSFLAGAKALDEINAAVRADKDSEQGSKAQSARQKMIERNRSAGEIK